MNVRLDVDVAVIGSGFAGSLTALCLRRLGRTVVLVERGRHPRFAIGESSTPLANLLFEELADRYDLPRIRPFSKWGTWQRTRPDVAVGLKRGFSFFFHHPGARFEDDDRHAQQLLVAASPHDEIGDTHWYRPDFDHALVREAESEGVTYLDETTLDCVREEGPGVVLKGTRGNRKVRIAAGFVVDATGPRGFLHRAFNLQEGRLRWLPLTRGLYSHFEGVERWEQLVTSLETPPYPIDDAAVHHVFSGGWIWILRFNNGLTSAGGALTEETAARLRTQDGVAAWQRLLDSVPSVRDQFVNARETMPFVHTPQLAFRAPRVCGAAWALLPSAAGVIDPLLSTGFPLTLLGIGRLVRILEGTEAGPERDAALRHYEKTTLDELDATERLVAALYATMTDPPLFKKLGLLYFAAASYSEAARRLGRPALAPGFLLNEHPKFAIELRECSLTALGSPQGRVRDDVMARIDRAIEPFDIAGLGDARRKDWYPVLPEDLIGGAPKLGATEDEIDRLLERSGFARARSG
jgi:tetracycline 7-halogenase / FADH2 O2-dependent halogenase